MSEELKPCPNPWGETEHVEKWSLQIWSQSEPTFTCFYIRCGCGISGPSKYTESEAITAWNTRPTQAPETTPTTQGSKMICQGHDLPFKKTFYEPCDHCLTGQAPPKEPTAYRQVDSFAVHGLAGSHPVKKLDALERPPEPNNPALIFNPHYQIDTVALEDFREWQDFALEMVTIADVLEAKLKERK